MATIDTAYLNDLVKRFKGYKSPTETQQLIILLGDRDNRSDADNRKLSVLLKAEKKADQLAKARADARRLLDAEKTKQRKARTRRMMIVSSAVESAINNDSEVKKLMRQVLQRVRNGNYISDRDKPVVKNMLDQMLESSTDDNHGGGSHGF